MNTLKKYIDMMVKKHINALLCHSKAGYGKTFNVLKELKRHDVEYTYISGVTTAVEVFKLLHANNGKILILDDIETLFQNDKIINLLKSALWNAGDNRIVTYKTTHKSLEGYPDSFIYTGQVIILANEIKGPQDKSFYALMSRCLVYELTYTTKELTSKSLKIIKSDERLSTQNICQVTKLIKKYNKIGYEYNFRMLQRMIEFVKYDVKTADALYEKSVEKNDLALSVERILKYVPAGEQYFEFHEETGKSKSTFYKIKQQIINDR